MPPASFIEKLLAVGKKLDQPFFCSTDIAEVLGKTF